LEVYLWKFWIGMKKYNGDIKNYESPQILKYTSQVYCKEVGSE